jgi:4-amino-4-deoxy-L-arabinose transferase-like glycosyltransferase
MALSGSSPARHAEDSAFWLALILLAAAVLRFYELGHGIPYAIGVDEPELMERVVAMMKTGDFNPHFFHYPGLYFYLLLPVACVKFVLGAAQGQWSALAQVSAADFYLWGRGLTAAMGTATVGLVYLGARRWGAPAALFASALLAVAPLHVRESHYVLTDVPTAFFVTLAWVLSLRALDRPTWSAFLLAGVAAGCATATKYTAGVSMLMPVLGALLALGGHRAPWVVAAACGAGLGYLAGAPYTVLDLPAFLNGFADLLRSYPPRAEGAEPGWSIYLKHFRLNFGWLTSLATAGGVVLALGRSLVGSDRAAWAITVVFPLAYFFAIADSGLIYARYLMPIVPAASVCGGAAAAVAWSAAAGVGASTLRQRSAAVIIGLALLGTPMVTSYAFAQRIARPTTAGQAFLWIQQNLPRDSKLLLEKYELRLPGSRYKVEHVPSLVASTLDEYRAAGVQYVVASSQVYGPFLEQPTLDAARYSAYVSLFEGAPELVRFRPTDTVLGPELRVLALSRDR